MKEKNARLLAFVVAPDAHDGALYFSIEGGVVICLSAG